MAAMVNVKVQEKTGVKSFSCEKFDPTFIFLTALYPNFLNGFYSGKKF